MDDGIGHIEGGFQHIACLVELRKNAGEFRAKEAAVCVWNGRDPDVFLDRFQITAPGSFHLGHQQHSAGLRDDRILVLLAQNIPEFKRTPITVENQNALSGTEGPSHLLRQGPVSLRGGHDQNIPGFRQRGLDRLCHSGGKMSLDLACHSNTARFDRGPLSRVPCPHSHRTAPRHKIRRHRVAGAPHSQHRKFHILTLS